MTGDLVVVQTNQPVQLYSARNMDYDALEKRLEEEEASFSRFPGDGLTHDGKRANGCGDTARRALCLITSNTRL